MKREVRGSGERVKSKKSIKEEWGGACALRGENEEREGKDRRGFKGKKKGPKEETGEAHENWRKKLQISETEWGEKEERGK